MGYCSCNSVFSFFSEISTESRMENARVAIITVSDTQEWEEKNAATAGIAVKSILAPMKNKIKLTPCFRKRNMPMMPFSAK